MTRHYCEFIAPDATLPTVGTPGPGQLPERGIHSFEPLIFELSWTSRQVTNALAA